MPLKLKSAIRLPLQWDQPAGRYRTADGRFIARRAVLSEVARLTDATARTLTELSVSYRDGTVSLAEWQTQFRDTIRAAHTLSAAIANGGRDAMTPSDWGRIGQKLRIQYEALNRFSLEVERTGKMNQGRVNQYARSVRSTFFNAQRLHLKPTTLFRWQRTKVESCSDCLEQSGRGAQPLLTFPDIGSLQCRHNCGCVLERVI